MGILKCTEAAFASKILCQGMHSWLLQVKIHPRRDCTSQARGQCNTFYAGWFCSQCQSAFASSAACIYCPLVWQYGV